MSFEKKRRASYTASLKLKVIERAKEANNSVAAREFSISEKLVRDWRKNEANLQDMPKSKKALRFKATPFEEMENDLNDWITGCRQYGYAVTRSSIRMRALQMAKEKYSATEGMAQFAASAGWYTRFKNRYGLCLRQRTKIVQKFNMAKRRRTAAHLRSHLSVFKVGYPIQKGYIARLLIVDGLSVPDVAKEVKAIVQANEPHKELVEGSLKSHLHIFKKQVLRSKNNLTAEWPSLIRLFLETVRTTFKFKRLPVEPVSSQSVHPSVPSPSRHPEPSTSPTSEMLLEPDIPVTPTLLQPVQNSTTINSPSCLMTCKLPSPRKLKNDCANCINKQRTNMNMLQKKKCLHQQSRKFKMLLKVEKGNVSLKRLNEKIKRKTQSVTKRKMRYASLSEACRDIHKLLKLVESLEQQVKTLEGKLTAALKENINMASVNERLESLLEKTENDNAHMTQVHEQLKSLLGKTEDDDVHMKQVYEQFKSILEDDVADLNRYSQASHSPEMEIIEESSLEEHPERSRWKETSVNDDSTAKSKDATSNMFMKDILCGERCQVKAEADCLDHGPSIYIDNAELPVHTRSCVMQTHMLI